jgi:DNA repair photolyase
MIKEINAQAILRTAKIVDTWFLGKYQISPYRGCQHACAYCDGRFEKYNFAGEFGTDIEIKNNSLELLKKEILRIKEPGFVMLGSGITDVYQPIESKYRLTRRILERLNETNLPVHILTKSTRIAEDLPLLEKINRNARSIVSMSIGHDNDKTRKILEPNTAPTADRWELLTQAKAAGMSTGVMLMPVIPYISDSAEEIERMLQKCKDAKVDFVLFGGMTLKAGRQKDHFLKVIQENYPALHEKIKALYSRNDQYGRAVGFYYPKINQQFYRLARKYKIQFRMPHELFKGLFPKYHEVALLLAHIGEYLQSRGIQREAYGHAGYALQHWAFERKKAIGRKKGFSYQIIEAEFLESIQKEAFKKLPGIGVVIQKMLIEFAQTGQIAYYNELRRDFIKH